MSTTPIWVVLPAAGAGKRFGDELPKQFQPLAGKPVLQHTIECFVDLPRLAGVVVALAAWDKHFSAVKVPVSMRLYTVTGGDERADSVLAALEWLHAGGEAHENDWVIVHDAARPLLPRADLGLLVEACDAGADGALLGAPVADTLKQADASECVQATVERKQLWRALTPQMFRLGPLRNALLAARKAGKSVTDESMAMELAGFQPRLVNGHGCNIKITHAGDMALAEAWVKGLEA